MNDKRRRVELRIAQPFNTIVAAFFFVLFTSERDYSAKTVETKFWLSKQCYSEWIFAVRR